MKPRRAKGGFTLIEVMFSLTIGGLVLTCISAILIQGMHIWCDFTGQWLICQQSRIAREKILRGTFGVGGLRDATTNNIAWYNNGSSRMFTFAKSSDSNHYYSIWTTSNGNMRCDKMLNGQSCSTDSQENSKEGVQCQLLNYTLTNQQLTCEYKMSVTTRGRTYSKVSEIKTTILNN